MLPGKNGSDSLCSWPKRGVPGTAAADGRGRALPRGPRPAESPGPGARGGQWPGRRGLTWPAESGGFPSSSPLRLPGRRVPCVAFCGGSAFLAFFLGGRGGDQCQWLATAWQCHFPRRGAQFLRFVIAFAPGAGLPRLKCVFLIALPCPGEAHARLRGKAGQSEA